MDVLALIVFTLAAWAIHLFLASRYIKLFPNTKSPEFRVVHVAEIGALILAVMALYGLVVDNTLSWAATAGGVLGTLAVVDIVFFLLSRRARQQFDLFHFAAAYGTILIVIFLYFSLFSVR